MSMKALCESISPLNMRFNSSLRTRPSRVAASLSISRAAASSFSLSASSSSSAASAMALPAPSSSSISALSFARSRPSSCALSGFCQMAGSSSSRLTSSSRSFLVSYSKKPPERAGALPEVFELALEQIRFHGRSWLVRNQRAILAGKRAARGGREDVVDEQLQAAFALKFIDIETVHQPRAAARQLARGKRLAVVEGDRIEGAPARGHLHPHLEMALADEAGAADGEHPIEARLGKRLSPRAARAQRVRRVERDFLHRELAIGFDQ